MSLKRLVVENHKVSQNALEHIMAAIANTRSPLVEIDLQTNLFLGSDISSEKSKEVVHRELLANVTNFVNKYL